MKWAIALSGLLAAVPVAAQDLYGLWQPDTAPPRLDAGRSSERSSRPVDRAPSYGLPLSRLSAAYGSVRLSTEPALGPPASYTRRFANLDSPRTMLSNDWVDYQGATSQVFTVGYRWRYVQVEGSTFSGLPEDERLVKTEWRKPSRSGRFSFRPAPNLSFQLSRGTLSNLDQLEPDGEVRRTTISATYKQDFSGADWHTTLAWGRNARKHRESTYGYLLESTLRLAKVHAVFGRVEEVGSDDILRENDSNRRQMFKMNKLTLGYVYDMRTDRHMWMDVGALMSRHYVPSTMTSTYGNDPVSYMMFVRFKLK